MDSTERATRKAAAERTGITFSRADVINGLVFFGGLALMVAFVLGCQVGS